MQTLTANRVTVLLTGKLNRNQRVSRRDGFPEGSEARNQPSSKVDSRTGTKEFKSDHGVN